MEGRSGGLIAGDGAFPSSVCGHSHSDNDINMVKQEETKR